ncbi:MAG TPA: Hsp70 family protein [Polyangia bacterium]|nr:Hsp70 family protein [Polyangia bacterium]
MSSFGVGIDFGTTNSAVAVADGAGARLLPLPGPAGALGNTWRTILYFESGDGVNEVEVSAGGRAIERYAQTEGQGRLVQSIKSHLASELFSATHVLGRRYRIEDLVATFLRQLRAAVPVDLGRRAVVGRPVRYWGARDKADEDRALDRMRTALGLAGFEEIVFEYEPVAAANRYAARLGGDELVLIADFGGGTSDFSLMRIGADKVPLVIGTSGVAVAGDSFDARIIDRVVAPALGQGTHYAAEFDRRMPVPPWLFTNLRRWHHLSFLRAKDTTALLQKILRGATAPAKIQKLISVVEDELGLPLHQSVEATKRALSTAEQSPFLFDQQEVGISSSVLRTELDVWIAEEVAAIDAAVDEVLVTAGVQATAVDRVFTTGGSSLVPAVQRILARRFGADRLVGGEELTSVAWGLAISAARL